MSAASLTGSPLRIPARKLAALGLVALLEPEGQGGRGRLTEVWQLSEAREGVSLSLLAPGDLPEGVTTANMATARDAVLSLMVEVQGTSGAHSSGANDQAGHHPLPNRSGSGLEQSLTGE